MNDSITYDRIESYLLHQMSEEERQAFEAEVKASPALSEQLERQRLEHKIMEVLIEDDLAGQIKKWHSEGTLAATTTPKTSSNESPSSSRQGRSKLIGGILLLLLLVVIVIWQVPSRKEQLVREHSTEEDLVDSTPKVPTSLEPSVDEAKTKIAPTVPIDSIEEPQSRPTEEKAEPRKPMADVSATNYRDLALAFREPANFESYNKVFRNPEESKLDQALAALEEDQYEQSIDQLSALLQEDSTDLNALFYLGIVHFESGQYQQAIPFLKATAQSQHLFFEHAAWKLILAYLHDSKIEEAKQLLKTIAEDEDHEFYTKGKELQERLIK